MTAFNGVYPVRKARTYPMKKLCDKKLIVRKLLEKFDFYNNALNIVTYKLRNAFFYVVPPGAYHLPQLCHSMVVFF